MDLAPKLLRDKLVFPEGSRWHSGKLWFSDMHDRKVYTLDERGKLDLICRVEGKPSGIGFLPDGRMLVVSMSDRRLLRLDKDGLKTAADLKPFVGGDTNDMVVDGNGRAYIGNMGWTPPEPFRNSTVTLVEPNGKHRVVADDIAIPNGCAITPDGKTLILAESRGNALLAYDIAADGSLSKRRVWAPLPDCTPDGLTLDAEGAIWVGCVTQGFFARVLEGGKITHRIPFPGKYAIDCCLGGADGKTLFLCIAETTGEQLRQSIAKGWIYTVRVDVPRAADPK